MKVNYDILDGEKLSINIDFSNEVKKGILKSKDGELIIKENSKTEKYINSCFVKENDKFEHVECEPYAEGIDGENIVWKTYNFIVWKYI